MAGTADEMVLYANNEVIASLIPGATMHSLPDVGHLFWWERPDEVVEAITKHCELSSTGTLSPVEQLAVRRSRRGRATPP